MTQDAWFWTFLTMDVSLAEKVARTIAVYLVIAFLIRFLGRRLIAQMTSLDLVVVLLLSNVVQNAIIGPDNSVLGGVVGAVVLIVTDLGLDRWADRSPRVRWLLEGTPTQLVRDGVVDESAMRHMGLSRRDLQLALRRMGAHDPREVESATLEPGGDVLLDLKPGDRPATLDDLRAAVAELKASLEGGAR